MKYILRILSIILIKFLQRRYKAITEKNINWRHSNQVLSKLKLIQAILYYFKRQFNAWGYFHPECTWSKEDEIFFNKLFPVKDFPEIDIVVQYNPEAVTYYKNKIHELTKGNPPCYDMDIKKQLIKWNCNN